jgi:hypothetical protein
MSAEMATAESTAVKALDRKVLNIEAGLLSTAWLTWALIKGCSNGIAPGSAQT